VARRPVTCEETMHEDTEPVIVPAIETRSDSPQRWSSVLPLALLALLGLMLLHACMSR
jgi:hypothetical protein